jgi:hypothetical protein
MRLSAPKKIVWWLSIILAVVGVVIELGIISVAQPFGIWIVLLGFFLLAAGNALKGF